LPLTEWESFYVIVGSSSAALTGLQFVVIALIAESQFRATSADIAAFGSPTIVHFCIALFVSASMSAPWSSLGSVGLSILAGGFVGASYAIVVMRRAQKQARYKPVFEDWLWHVILPFLAYIALLIAGIMLRRVPTPSLFVIGAATLFLVYIGIHNAWDSVTFLTLTRNASNDTSSNSPNDVTRHEGK
jgi:hypothetical protein